MSTPSPTVTVRPFAAGQINREERAGEVEYEGDPSETPMLTWTQAAASMTHAPATASISRPIVNTSAASTASPSPPDRFYAGRAIGGELGGRSGVEQRVSRPPPGSDQGQQEGDRVEFGTPFYSRRRKDTSLLQYIGKSAMAELLQAIPSHLHFNKWAIKPAAVACFTPTKNTGLASGQPVGASPPTSATSKIGLYGLVRRNWHGVTCGQARRPLRRPGVDG